MNREMLQLAASLTHVFAHAFSFICTFYSEAVFRAVDGCNLLSIPYHLAFFAFHVCTSRPDNRVIGATTYIVCPILVNRYLYIKLSVIRYINYTVEKLIHNSNLFEEYKNQRFLYRLSDTILMKCCDMKGFLSYLILWNLGKKSMNGSELARELEKRRGTKPSPGTIYPALKELTEKGLIVADKGKAYSLTKKGKEELKSACSFFCNAFYDMKDMFKCC